jgi:hypothetical protein
VAISNLFLFFFPQNMANLKYGDFERLFSKKILNKSLPHPCITGNCHQKKKKKKKKKELGGTLKLHKFLWEGFVIRVLTGVFFF